MLQIFLVILGDTCDNGRITELCSNADVMVHESTNEISHKEKCVANGHSTPGMIIIIINLLTYWIYKLRIVYTRKDAFKLLAKYYLVIVSDLPRVVIRIK